MDTSTGYQVIQTTSGLFGSPEAAKRAAERLLAEAGRSAKRQRLTQLKAALRGEELHGTPIPGRLLQEEGEGAKGKGLAPASAAAAAEAAAAAPRGKGGAAPLGVEAVEAAFEAAEAAAAPEAEAAAEAAAAAATDDTDSG